MKSIKKWNDIETLGNKEIQIEYNGREKVGDEKIEEKLPTRIIEHCKGLLNSQNVETHIHIVNLKNKKF